MATDLETHRTRVIYGIEHKLEEMFFFHGKIIETCTLAMERTVGKASIPMIIHKEVNYYFSSFVNCVQSLKDMLTTVVGSQVTWSTFETIPYFGFFKNARNAITHDGLELITSMSGGNFLFNRAGGVLTRPGQRGEAQHIHFPVEPVALVCIRFFNAFLLQILDIVAKNEAAFIVSTQAGRDLLLNWIENMHQNMKAPMPPMQGVELLTEFYEKHLATRRTLAERLAELIQQTHLQPEVAA